MCLTKISAFKMPILYFMIGGQNRPFDRTLNRHSDNQTSPCLCKLISVLDIDPYLYFYLLLAFVFNKPVVVL